MALTLSPNKPIIHSQPMLDCLELGYWSAGCPVILCDPEQSQTQENPQTPAGHSILLVTATTDDDSPPRQAMQMLATALTQKIPALARWEPMTLRAIVRFVCARLEKKQPHIADDLKACRMMLIHDLRLFNLNQATVTDFSVYRRGALLDFHVGPHQYVQLEPGDLLLMGNADLIRAFRQQGLLRVLTDAGTLPHGFEQARQAFSSEDDAENGIFDSLWAIRMHPDAAAHPSALSAAAHQRPARMGRWLLIALYGLITTLLLLGVFVVLK